ncbi:MAG: eukaryotic-like serine/threonine-protein kinase [Thermoanaerobaculia bacterium]|jgi:serine/threonine protein kinase|nr:eukaryotic-like serine/threonine-protein kinase [Thermoanaerobaculia bacterium]
MRRSVSDLPQSVDRFDVVRILGKGGMGTVYLARDQRLDRLVAVKVLHAEDLAAEDRRARFLREARTAAAIRHANVATIYEVGETDEGVPFIVMEYCEGETLSQRMRRRPIEAGEFLSIARQIAAGAAAAHEGGIVHRDLKSANIMIEPTGLVKILDFGLAKTLPTALTTSRESSASRMFGTLHYLAPEQIRGIPADARTDLFSIGVIFFQMATGQLPFNADAPLMVLEKIRDSEPEPFVARDPAFPAAATKIIGKLLKKEPDNRYQTARDLLADLEELDTPTARFPTSASRSHSSLGRTRPRPRWMRLVVTILAFVIGAGVIVYFNRHTKPEAQAAPSTSAPPPIRSMAVMPLDNISNNTKDDFLSVGLADALVTKLQQIPSLQVRPTSAISGFHNKKVDTKTAADQLHVDSVLEGHFLAAGDLVRVNLQLTDSRTGYNVWADTIDGKRADLIKLIDDVSSRTVAGLNQKLGVQKSGNASEPRSSNPRAFEEYLRARALSGSLVPAEHQAEENALRRAIALDSNFAAAYADLAIAMSLGQTRGLDNGADVTERAEFYARQAVRLDPNLAAAHLALGRVFVRLPERFREAVRENLAALRLNPNDTNALNNVANYYVSVGDTQRVRCLGDRLISLDPNSNEAKIRGYWYVNAVDPEGALTNSPAAMAGKDTELAGRDIRANAFILLGNLPSAEAETARITKLVPQHYLGKSLRAMIAASKGDRATAEAALKSFEPDANRLHWAAMRQALVYAKLGDRDAAMHWVNRSAELGNHSWFAWVKHPWTQSLQTDPEFQTVLGKMKADLDDVGGDVIGVYQLICRPSGPAV